jgi:phospholipase C
VSPLPASAGGIVGPVGLGFRVPCILMSPFTAGGYTATDVFDHTSTLPLLEKLFGVSAPNVSAWRRGGVRPSAT